MKKRNIYKGAFLSIIMEIKEFIKRLISRERCYLDLGTNKFIFVGGAFPPFFLLNSTESLNG